ncbi:NAD(P)H-quinone oxidoreductase [Ottowia sp. VDI28]|uniref:NAD(P)H-quinone oxidoreductase n=1 Tax=Ottowia sp. VDI28 TaxID=3133968 RepID=UPI003C2EB819
MRAVVCEGFGDPSVLRAVERPVPGIGAGEVLVRVAAAGVNRPDATQRLGLYPPPPGVTDIPGLDIAGEIVACGAEVGAWRAGDVVCALIPGGGYAEYAAAPAATCLPVPAGLEMRSAAALPEVCFTAWTKLMEAGRLGFGESVLIQGGTSGVGLAAIQMARALRGARVIVTASTAEKRAQAEAFGADAAIDYRVDDWPDQVRKANAGLGVDVILDAQGGDYVPRELALLSEGGRLVLLGAHRGVESTINVRDLIRRRLSIVGSVIRSRTLAEKRAIAKSLVENVWPLLAKGVMRIPVHATFPLERAEDAHWMLERNEQAGKIVLDVR